MSAPTAFLLAVVAVCMTSCLIVHPQADRCDIKAICVERVK